jgi:hypothetical protein
LYYLVAILFLMLVLPVGSVLTEGFPFGNGTYLIALAGKWFTFWAVGVRLFLAGLAQTFRPQFTAKSIFEIEDPAALAIVREVGFANVSMGTLGLLSLPMPQWLVPAAIVGSLYYGLAGIGHVGRSKRNAKEQLALASDLGMFALLAGFVAIRGF